MRPKIMIQKKFILDAKGHFRYNSPSYSLANRKYKPQSIVLNLDPISQYHRHTGEEYPQINLRTERQLVYFIYSNWGPGTYYVTAFLKGREGSWVFWKGDMNEDGWIFENKNYKDPDVKQVENEIARAQSEEEKDILQEDLDFFKEMAKEEKKATRYGFLPFLRSSGKRGEFHSWNEDDPGLENNAASNIREVERTNRRTSTEEMSLDDINNF
jgi:hypothetical protein